MLVNRAGHIVNQYIALVGWCELEQHVTGAMFEAAVQWYLSGGGC